MQNLHHVATEDSLYLFIVRPFLLPSIHEKLNKKGKRKKKEKRQHIIKKCYRDLSNKADSKWLPKQVNFPSPSASSYRCTLKASDWSQWGKGVTRRSFHMCMHTHAPRVIISKHQTDGRGKEKSFYDSRICTEESGLKHRQEESTSLQTPDIHVIKKQS